MSDDPPPEDFDYGDRIDDGQFENHPTKDEGEFVQEVRTHYVHDDCNGITSVSPDIAESIARDPSQYDKTFCANCREYVPVSDVHWHSDGADWDMRDNND